jgi:hypothetical protein
MEFLAPGFNVTKALGRETQSPPYLFIIFSDILQQLILQAFTQNDMVHPIRDDLPPATIQYADDTLILARASPQAAQKLKSILQLFQEVTGLHINFQKTTLITLNTQPSEEQHIANALDTSISSFPQTYLGLPLSPSKLPPSAFQPLMIEWTNT